MPRYALVKIAEIDDDITLTNMLDKYDAYFREDSDISEIANILKDLLS